MRVALQLAPDSRHVLRSAARLFLHGGDPERAHDLIRRNPGTRHDPWLVAAEIALADQAERKPHFITDGVAALNSDKHLPRQVTELAGAVGTRFLADGSRKRGKRLFQKSLLDPTGNSLAQAEWASKAFGEVLVQEQQLVRSVDASEAQAFHAFWAGDFRRAFKHAKQWMEEEPFSSRAFQAAIGSASILEDYVTAKDISIDAREHDPKSLDHLNSLIFSHACLGEIGEARRLLRLIAARSDVAAEVSYVAEANRGLVAMRSGDLEGGRTHYKTAIAGFTRLQRPVPERLARAYFAREAVLAGMREGPELVTEAKRKNTNPIQQDVACVLASAELHLARKAQQLSMEGVLVTRSA